MIKIGMMIGDRYEILEKIGTGGMSDVYKAKCHKLNRMVAVKVLKQEFSENENFVSKFKVEAQAAAGLMHPNITNVYDVGNENGIYFIVMELVEGITLKKYIEKKARISVKEAVSIAIQISMGIEAAHNNHIIHRDIKPQNIIISKDGKVKVADFGIAKAATSDTITSNVMGSVHYTSPEQARGGFSDEKSDIYSLGITLFEMLTGRVPFNGDTTVAIAIKHIQEPMPSPREYVNEIPRSVEQILSKCTQKSPDRRYNSMGELIQDLKRSLMNPDADFVKMVDPDEEASTKFISNQDMNQIKQVAQSNQAIRLNNTKSKIEKNAVDELEEEEEEPEDSKMEKITTILAVIAAILIGVIVIFLVGRAVGVFDFSSSTNAQEETTQEATNSSEDASEQESGKGEVEIPNVLGRPKAEAVTLLQDKGFQVEYASSQHDPEIAKDHIISQTPMANEKGKLGDTVILVSSLGPNEEESVSVPNLIGSSEMDAVLRLKELGLEAGSIEQTTNSDESLIDKVCYQSYSVGSRVKKGTVIDLKISIGVGESSYSFVGSIAGPGEEDENYRTGIQTTVILNTSVGTEIYRTNTTTFPLNLNITGIKGAEDGIITFIYTVDVPGSSVTNENGEVITTPGSTEERSIQRSVRFAKE
ncbi:MAG: Stk1 family PASTA domain-containing Ser/Thr kinase [Lachnospiraceae bacterium]